MKQLNIMNYISEATRSFDEKMEKIKEAADVESVKRKAAVACGYIDAMTDLTNCMIDKENNDITQQLDWLITDWEAKAYRAAGWRILDLGDQETGLKFIKVADDISKWNNE